MIKQESNTHSTKHEAQVRKQKFGGLLHFSCISGCSYIEMIEVYFVCIAASKVSQIRRKLPTGQLGQQIQAHAHMEHYYNYL